jgi:hypothetical protein
MRVNRPGRGALLRRLLVCGSLTLACANASAFKRQALPDGSYRVECDQRLSRCLIAIEEVCAKGYDVVQASDDVNYRGPIEPNEPTLNSQVTARCKTESVLGGRKTPAPAPPPAPTSGGAADASKPSAPASCFPGATQACIGAGGCRGGQQCLADGAAFGPCDCGTAPAAAPAADGPAPPR